MKLCDAKKSVYYIQIHRSSQDILDGKLDEKIYLLRNVGQKK